MAFGKKPASGSVTPVPSGKPVPLFQALQSLPKFDPSGLFPLAFIEIFRRLYQHYYENSAARKTLIKDLGVHGLARTDAVTFILALAACRKWRTDEARYANLANLSNLIKRCQRRAKRKKGTEYAQIKQLSPLRLHFRPRSIARWQTYITWGFACARNPTEPTWRVLQEFVTAIAKHVYDADGARFEQRDLVNKSTNSIRANTFRYRGRYGERAMAERSAKHFDALRRQLTHRGIIPVNMRIPNW